MSSQYFFRLNTVSRKKGESAQQNEIPIYAVKAGDTNGSQWHTGKMSLEILEMITLASDGARMLTVCTDYLHAYRALENKDVDVFDLFIRDTTRRQSALEANKLVAGISCRDMTGGTRSSIDRNRIKMSCEPMPNSLVTVTLSFFAYDGGPRFYRIP